MKRVNGLYKKMKDPNTAVQAIICGTQHKHHLKEVQKRFLCEDLHTIDMQKVSAEAEKLCAGVDSWVPSALTVKYFHRPGHKDRQLAVPTLTDHLNGWMLIITIKSILMRGMHPFCIGSIPGRGIEYGRSAVERWVQHDRDAIWFVKLDIRHYYSNIDLEQLKRKFRKIIKDQDMLRLIDMHIDMSKNAIDADQRPHPSINGLPIGTYTAPWFANFYLQDLDHFISEQLFKTRRGKRQNYIHHYLRNIDDILLIGSNRRDLEKSIHAIIAFIAPLGLGLHENWEIKRVGEMIESNGEYRLKPGTYPLDILGYRFYKAETTVRSKIYLNTMKTARKIRKDLNHGKIMLHDAQALVSMVGWFSHSDSKNFMRQIHEIVPLKFVKGVIGYAAKNGIIGTSSAIYCEQRRTDGHYHILYGHSGGTARGGNGVYSYCVGHEGSVAGQPCGKDRKQHEPVVPEGTVRSVQLSLF